MKLLLWAAIIFAVVWILRSKKSAGKEDTSAPPRTANRAVEPMSICAHCGTYFPASEALFDSSNAAFCSDEHRRQHAAR
jgi:uncharacterized protein